MEISINNQNQDRILRKIESGKYGSPDDVIAKALELLDQHDDDLQQELDDLRASVRKGSDQAAAGELIPASKVFDELKQRNDAAHRKSGPPLGGAASSPPG